MILLQFTAFYDEVSLLLIAINVFFSYLILSLSVLSLQHCESGNAAKKKNQQKTCRFKMQCQVHQEDIVKQITR